MRKLCFRMDALTSELSSPDLSIADRRSKLLHRDALQQQLERKRRALHVTLARLYGGLFTAIARPDFRVKPLTSYGRGLSHKITRRMRLLGFCAFKELLKQTSKKTGLRVLVIHEGYSSGTCGSCGCWFRNLGASKVFRCPKKACRAVETRGVLLSHETSRFVCTLPLFLFSHITAVSDPFLLL